MKKIILASASPRRAELLKRFIVDFQVVPSDIDERIDISLGIENELSRLAHKKSESISQKERDAIVIAADTEVVYSGKVLGKPSDRDDALKMLNMLNNSVHTVITAVSVRCMDKKIGFLEKTNVVFNNNSDELLNWYVNTNEPYDKAGGYGIQGLGVVLVKNVEGSYNNVVGLPLSALINLMLRENLIGLDDIRL